MKLLFPGFEINENVTVNQICAVRENTTVQLGESEVTLMLITDHEYTAEGFDVLIGTSELKIWRFEAQGPKRVILAPFCTHVRLKVFSLLRILQGRPSGMCVGGESENACSLECLRSEMVFRRETGGCSWCAKAFHTGDKVVPSWGNELPAVTIATQFATKPIRLRCGYPLSRLEAMGSHGILVGHPDANNCTDDGGNCLSLLQRCQEGEQRHRKTPELHISMNCFLATQVTFFQFQIRMPFWTSHAWMVEFARTYPTTSCVHAQSTPWANDVKVRFCILRSGNTHLLNFQKYQNKS